MGQPKSTCQKSWTSRERCATKASSGQSRKRGGGRSSGEKCRRPMKSAYAPPNVCLGSSHARAMASMLTRGRSDSIRRPSAEARIRASMRRSAAPPVVSPRAATRSARPGRRSAPNAAPAATAALPAPDSRTCVSYGGAGPSPPPPGPGPGPASPPPPE